MKKYALITGSTKGIGKQIAIDLIREGHFVILNYAHSDIDAEKAKIELNEISDQFRIVKADLATMAGLGFLLKEIEKITPVMDYLILNAGATDRSAFNDITVDNWNAIVNTTLTIPFFLIQKLEKCIRANGRVIFIGSVLGRIPHAVSISYGVSKSALEMLAKYLVPIFSPRSITVNVVAPGFTDTEWQATKKPPQRKRIEDTISLKRFASVWEISSTCIHLINNGYITGQTIVVDGGYFM
jgi:3-oxoacyl-[acyl-carrier protein] reductase